MKKLTKQVLFGLGAVVSGAAALAFGSYYATKKMVAIALERDKSGKTEHNGKVGEKIQGFALDDAFMEAVRLGSEKLQALETELVEIESYDGIKLVGHWFENPEAKRVIVAMHGWRSSWSRDFSLISDFWMKNGCSILFAEQRGQGESGGDYMGFGLMERYDCVEWANWVSREKAGDMPVYLAGISMGASTVLMSASLGLPENVCGMMADCGYTSPHAIWKHVAENNLHLSYGILGRIADDMCRKKIHVGTKDFSTVDAMLENRIPVLFVHGSDDHFVPVEMTYENYKACAAEKRLLVVPGAEHAMSYYTDRDGYEKAVKDFWRDFDFSPHGPKE